MGNDIENLLPVEVGESLTWDKLEKRSKVTRDSKYLELVGGKVYWTPPGLLRHGQASATIIGLVGVFMASTRGCQAAKNATCLMFGDAPQPDVLLYILEEFGGQTRSNGEYLQGAPELLVEVCISTADRDLHEKKDLYCKAGAREYIVILPLDGKLLWHRLVGDKYELILPSNGITRSLVFPGFWLSEDAVLKGDTPRCIEILNAGLASPEHAEFVAELAGRRK